MSRRWRYGRLTERAMTRGLKPPLYVTAVYVTARALLFRDLRSSLQGLLITEDACKQCFGNALTIFFGLEHRRVLLVGDEGYLRQHAGHRRAEQNHERRLLDAEVPDAAVGLLQLRMQRVLDHRREVARLVDLVVERDRFHDV